MAFAPFWCCCEDEECFHEFRPCPEVDGCDQPPRPPPPPPISPPPPGGIGDRPPGIGPGRVMDTWYLPCGIVPQPQPGEVYRVGEFCYEYVRDVDELLGPKLAGVPMLEIDCKTCCSDLCFVKAEPCPETAICPAPGSAIPWVPCDELPLPGDGTVFMLDGDCYELTDETTNVPPPMIVHPTTSSFTCDECCEVGDCLECQTQCMVPNLLVESPTLVSNGCGCVLSSVPWYSGPTVCFRNLPPVFVLEEPCPGAPQVTRLHIIDAEFECVPIGESNMAWQVRAFIQYIEEVNPPQCPDFGTAWDAVWRKSNNTTCPHGAYIFDHVLGGPVPQFPPTGSCCGTGGDIVTHGPVLMS